VIDRNCAAPAKNDETAQRQIEWCRSEHEPGTTTDGGDLSRRLQGARRGWAQIQAPRTGSDCGVAIDDGEVVRQDGEGALRKRREERGLAAERIREQDPGPIIERDDASV